MKPLISAIIICIVLAGCNSPAKQHNKEVQHKADKLQNVTSGPLAPKHDSSTQLTDTTANSAAK